MSRAVSKEDLVQKFAAASARHHEGLLAGDYKAANKEAKSVAESLRRLREFGSEGYSALLPLLSHDNSAVALSAAVVLLEFTEPSAVATLKRLSKGKGLLGFRALQALQRWQEDRRPLS